MEETCDIFRGIKKIFLLFLAIQQDFKFFCGLYKNVKFIIDRGSSPKWIRARLNFLYENLFTISCLQQCPETFSPFTFYSFA